MSAHTAPVLTNTFRSDRVLQAWLRRHLPAPMREAIDADLDALGEQAVQAWTEARTRSAQAPVLTQFDAWGERIDRIELTPTWQRSPELSARFGLVAAGHEDRFGEFARCDQFLRVYLHHVASEFFTCPLAMSDGEATALRHAGNTALIERSLPRLLARDPQRLWLSGQWMTELNGGSDVSRSETEARCDANGQWRLHGRKWFTSAVIGDMALTLARPQGQGAGPDALALFHVETRDANGRWNGIRIDRLKQKLGTHELPTAEIHLDGTLATPVAGLDHGVRRIAPMLNVTRTWNAVCALATQRRCLDLAWAFARQRQAFGRHLVEHALHRDTLAGMEAEFTAAFHLVMHVAHLLGREERGLADADQRATLRLLTPLAKLWTGKLAVHIASETCEAFGGAGYIENTGIPQLLRDAQVFPIWEGTTNVLALDFLRATGQLGLDPLQRQVEALLGAEAQANGAAAAIRASMDACLRWLDQHAGDADGLQAGARRLALGLARTFAAALLHRHAGADAMNESTQALRRFSAEGLAGPIERPTFNPFDPH